MPDLEVKFLRNLFVQFQSQCRALNGLAFGAASFVCPACVCELKGLKSPVCESELS